MFEQILHDQLMARPSPGERRAWERSIPVLAQDLVDAGLGNVEVLLEHRLPLSSRRVDAIVAGCHPVTRRASYVVVELKQWSSAEVFEDDPRLVTIDAYGHRPRLHPVEQVRGYCEYLLDFLPALQDDTDSVAGAAYLHNATERAVLPLRQHAESDHGRLFTGGRRDEFLRFLRARLAPDVPGSGYADAFLACAARPSRQLLAVAAEEIRHQEQFVLLDQQQLAYNVVLHATEAARQASTKTVVIVTGGPGSGKSVIALSLLGDLARQGRAVMHATGSRSFTQTLRQVTGRGSPRTKRLFSYFNQFTDADRNGLELLILDEAHRIRETSASRFTPARLRTGRPQVDELIAAARVPVFLLDQHQVVRPGEMGTVADIEAHAKAAGLLVRQVPLDSQFRCGGSQQYLAWVERLLGLRRGGPVSWPGDPGFTLRVADSPEEMEHALQSRVQAGYSARIAAGFCWPWSDPRSDETLEADVVIDGWSRPWNVKGDRSVGGAPPAALWATDPAGFGQVGCIYTAQGFEYDWNGVIIGPDLVWRSDALIAVRSANRDPDMRSQTKVPATEFGRLVRNVYKVLLTRGMVGTILYSPDAQTRELLHSLVT
ncbi:MAG: DNA/RNA helicase domain-containing protein [Streptosporangiaceae bacterium]